jgi:hypothetical protein
MARYLHTIDIADIADVLEGFHESVYWEIKIWNSGWDREIGSPFAKVSFGAIAKTDISPYQIGFISEEKDFYTENVDIILYSDWLFGNEIERVRGESLKSNEPIDVTDDSNYDNLKQVLLNEEGEILHSIKIKLSAFDSDFTITKHDDQVVDEDRDTSEETYYVDGYRTVRGEVTAIKIRKGNDFYADEEWAVLDESSYLLEDGTDLMSDYTVEIV